MKKLLIVSFALTLAFVFTACGAQVQSAALAASLALERNKTAQLAPEYTFDKALEGDALTETVAQLAPVYTSSDEAVATVDASGLVTAVDGGTATISMTLGKAVTAQCTVTVTVPVQSVAADSSLALSLNGTESGSVNARVIPSNATAALLTYESSDEAVATVDSTGKVTAVANGQAVITVSCDGKTAQTKVTVTTKATGVALNSAAGWIYVGGGHTLKPSTLPTEAPASTYTYASANTSVATVNDNGVITGKSVGSAKITVKSADGFATEYTITVNAKPAPPKPKPNAKPNTVTGGSVAASGGAAAGGGDAGGGVVAPDQAPTPEPAPAPPPADVVAGLPVTPGDGNQFGSGD